MHCRRTMADRTQADTCVDPALQRDDGSSGRAGITYGQLVEKLTEIGVSETEPSIRNKLSQGKFTAVSFIKCLFAIGCQVLRLESD